MSLYKGNSLISGLNTPIQHGGYVGQLITSLIPLNDAGLHLLDGSTIDCSFKNYEDFYDTIMYGYNDGIYINGTLTNNDGVFSGFSSSDYIEINNAAYIDKNHAQDFIFTLYNLNFTTSSDVTTSQVLISSQTLLEVKIESGKLYFYNWQSSSYVQVGTVTANTNYIFSLDFRYGESLISPIPTITTNITYFLINSTDPSQPLVGTSSDNVIDTSNNYPVKIGVSLNTDKPFLGEIDIKNSYIKMNNGNNIIWNGARYNIVTSDYPSHVITESQYQQEINSYGVCGKFTVDILHRLIRLPKLVGMIEGTNTESDLGNITPAGLPNITGSVSFRRQTNAGNMNIASGAFHDDGLDGTANSTYYSTGSTNQYNLVSFSASRSNAIYGGSNTVQPQTIKYFPYIVVSTSANV